MYVSLTLPPLLSAWWRGVCCVGQMMVLYFPPLQTVFRCEALTWYDLCFVVALASTMLLLDTVRKRYFPSFFTELLPNEYNTSKGKKVGVTEKSGVQDFLV